MDLLLELKKVALTDLLFSLLSVLGGRKRYKTKMLCCTLNP